MADQNVPGTLDSEVTFELAGLEAVFDRDEEASRIRTVDDAVIV